MTRLVSAVKRFLCDYQQSVNYFNEKWSEFEKDNVIAEKIVEKISRILF